MKKMLAVFVSLGVILFIAGLTILGIYGGEAIKKISWGDVVNGTNHDLSSADSFVNYKKSDLEDKLVDGKFLDITIQTNTYAVYVMPAEDDVLSVHYVEPQDDHTHINVSCNPSVKIEQTDDRHFHWFDFTSYNHCFIAVYIPQSEAFDNVRLSIKCNVAGIKVKDLTLQGLRCSTDTGSISVESCTAVDACTVYSDTGALSVTKFTSDSLTAATKTGSVNVSESNVTSYFEIKVNTGSIKCMQTVTPKLFIESDTGSVTFDVTADDIHIESDTGSVKGTVQGSKNDYEIKCKTDTGSCNLSNQNPEGATKKLSINVDTGSINVDFSEN